MRSTVFVIGAGASAEVNFPTGVELKNILSRILDIKYDSYGNLSSGDPVIGCGIKEMCLQSGDSVKTNREIRDFMDVFRRIKKHLPLSPSIDNYIDSNRGDKKISLCGKIGLVKTILLKEKESLLYVNTDTEKTLNYSALEETWYTKLFHLITESSNKSDAKSKLANLIFIVFNYDRCFEYFMYHALKDFYALSDAEIIEWMKSLKIYHPYGSVGALPFEKKNDSIGFGANVSYEQMLLCSQRICTFTERIDDKLGVIEDIRGIIINAAKIVFLGFSFLPINMSLLFGEKNKRIDKKSMPICYATTYKLSDYNIMHVKNSIASNFGKNDVQVRYLIADINTKSCKCVELFDEFNRGLYI